MRTNDHFITGGILIKHRMEILGSLRYTGTREKREILREFWMENMKYMNDIGKLDSRMIL
jgi:hypothetical protein